MRSMARVRSRGRQVDSAFQFLGVGKLWSSYNIQRVSAGQDCKVLGLEYFPEGLSVRVACCAHMHARVGACDAVSRKCDL
jgi:hypothetical protein